MPSKLCPHSLNAHGDVIAMVEAGSPAVKLVGFLGLSTALRAAHPGLLLIGRIFETYDAHAAAESGAAATAEALAWVTRQAETYRLNPAINAWEGPNEPVFGSADDPANVRALAWYAAFETERLRLLADRGLRGVIGNFATGNPDLPLWPAFLPAVAAAKQFHGFLGLHEYSSPWMWWLTGDYQTGNCDHRPGFAGEGDTGFVTLRYRKVYRTFFEPQGLGDVPLVITECGLDSIGAVCPGQTSGPWKNHFDFWNRHDGATDPIDYWRGPERDPERYYAEQLAWYDQQLQQDPYVVGATIFTVGNVGGFDRFDIAETRALRHVVDYVRSQRDVPPVTGTPRRPDPDTPATGTIFVPPGPEPADPPAPSLLFNSRFAKGTVYFAGETPELAVPTGWALDFRDANAPRLPGQTEPFGRPVTALLNSTAVEPADRARLFAHGPYCWKVAGPSAPLWVRLSQEVAGLPAGRYRLEARLLRDPGTPGDKGAARLVAESGSQTVDGGWRANADLPANQYTRLTLDFSATGPTTLLALEMRLVAAPATAAFYVVEVRLAPAA